MSMEIGDAPPAKESREGAPPWVMTFADLMSLLMCFFVLLLAFSEMDKLKFKQLAGSMREAFGVQREIKAKEIPKGTSIVAQEFTPGRPDPTPIRDIRQHTTDDLKDYLQTYESLMQQRLEEEAEEIRESFQDELDSGLIDIETEDQRIIIRIRERGAFPSGNAEIVQDFRPVLTKISDVLSGVSGQIVIAGHTDSVPISTQRFRSNWELSAARAVTVVHHLLSTNEFPPERFLIEGHADSRPLAPNDSGENRALNRRVEIVIVKGDDLEGEELSTANTR